MTNVLLLVIIGYLIYKEVRERTSFKGMLKLEPIEAAKETYSKEINKEEFEKEKQERDQLQKEFDDTMSYNIDDAINFYKRGDE